MSEQPLWVWGLLGGLLLCSAFFSSSETALFSLTRGQRARASDNVRALLARPRLLLLSVLFFNLIVNLLFFAFASRLFPGGAGGADFLVGLVALLSILVVGEILPKTLGLRARAGVARWAAPILRVAVWLLRPISAPVLKLLDLANRTLSVWVREEQRVTTEVLTGIMERGAKDGELLGMEADLLSEILELEEIRVREIMTPRVDVIFLDINGAKRDEAVRAALELRQSWLPVIERDPDHVVGRVPLRDLLRDERSVRQLVMPVKFVPEVASALALLRGLRQDRTAEAIVVDEWGGTAGIVTAEDVFEEIVGDLREEGESREQPVVPLGEGRYRVAGSLSIRDWNGLFGQTIVPTEFETVGGFVAALLGKIPRTGDVARIENLVMQVHEVRGRRVQTVDIGVEEAVAEGGEATR